MKKLFMQMHVQPHASAAVQSKAGASLHSAGSSRTCGPPNPNKINAKPTRHRVVETKQKENTSSFKQINRFKLRNRVTYTTERAVAVELRLLDTVLVVLVGVVVAGVVLALGHFYKFNEMNICRSLNDK